MKRQHVDDQMVPYPKIRRFMAAEFPSTQHTPMIHGLIEVDVSRARAHLRDQKAKTGESLSCCAPACVPAALCFLAGPVDECVAQGLAVSGGPQPLPG